METIVVTTYKTKDGKRFTDKARAEAHEHKLKNKTVHYIIDFANLTVSKVLYLQVQDTIFAGHDKPIRTFIYETESGTQISDESIDDKSYIIIMSQESYAIHKKDIMFQFNSRKYYEDIYSSSKFLNTQKSKIPRKKEKK